MTTVSRNNDAITLSRMNFSGYEGHMTKFSGMFTIPYCTQ